MWCHPSVHTKAVYASFFFFFVNQCWPAPSGNHAVKLLASKKGSQSIGPIARSMGRWRFLALSFSLLGRWCMSSDTYLVSGVALKWLMAKTAEKWIAGGHKWQFIQTHIMYRYYKKILGDIFISVSNWLDKFPTQLRRNQLGMWKVLLRLFNNTYF